MDQRCKPGAGLRSEHYPALEAAPPKVIRWFEALTENYLDTEGRPLTMLSFVRRDFPVALHGVSLSIGSVGGLNPVYLRKVKELIDVIQPFIVSDHLCWTSSHGGNSHDLLPLPYTDETLDLLVDHIDQYQNVIGRMLVLENPSTYLTFAHSTYTEWDFLCALTKRSGCKLLLDVNNVYVSGTNHGFDPSTYIAAIPTESVAQVHLAGFTDMDTYLFDTHSMPVHSAVWALFRAFIKRAPDVPFMVEWDADIPDLDGLEAEVSKAVAVWNQYHG